MKAAAISSLLSVGIVFAPAVAQDVAPADPLELGLEESVEVQFVLVDFLVVDRQGRTVPGLEADDFLLLVDGELVEIATLDAECPTGASADPRAGEAVEPDPSPGEGPRQMVLVFDYYHMTGIADTVERVLAMIDEWPDGDDRHMIASLGEVVRLETPFTSDRDELRWALRRMRNDRDLYAGQYGRLTERRFFDRMRVLFDLMERLPGRKSIVLFSGPFMPDGFHHDPEYKALSGLSASARTSVYPVDVGGLRTPGDQGFGALGGPGELRRLANETGGRMTADTNDITLAYARARRDLGCSYTLGFYDRPPRQDKNRRLTIRVTDRRGLRVVYPEYYVVRSPEKKRASLLRTAAMAPHMFDSDQLDVELFVLGPQSTSRWRTVFGVEIRLGPDEIVGEGETWELEAFLRKPNGTIIRSFKREIPMPATDPTTGRNPTVELFHEIGAPPGRYVASVVLSDPDGAVPRATTRSATLAEIPRGDPFLVGPILGRQVPAVANGVAGEEEPPFRPLIDGSTEAGQPLDALTVLCVRETQTEQTTHTVMRSLTAIDGSAVRRFDDVAVELSGAGGVRCRELIDTLSTDLAPGRYEVRAHAESRGFVSETGTAGLTVEPAAPRR
ncbi:MAG TPA: VWA domain-containing protein [Candidatus Polarisedimenticolaceae bacterium]|nr:VWA domain-containing protein [Candidatus Polarisedimenticolaceae bacterium]